jgi:hypothetical protein
MPPKKRKHFTHKKAHSLQSAASNDDDDSCQLQLKATASSKQELCQMLWAEDYWELIDKTLADHPELAQLISAFVSANQSRYKERLDGEKLARYLRKEKFKLATILQSVLALGHNIKGTECIKLIKSGVLLRQHCGSKRWSQDVKAGIVMGKDATVEHLKRMKQVRPEPKGQFTPFLVEVCIDQLHLRVGCRKRGYHRSVERADEEGNKVTVKSMTVMNLHEYPIENSLLGLTEEEVEWMRFHGPYTESKDEVFDELDYVKAVNSLYDFWEEDCEILSLVMEMPEMSGATDLDILLALAARPKHHCKPTPMKIHKPKLDRDTNCYDDTQDIWTWIMCKFPEAIAVIINADGQGNGMICNTKNIRTERYTACIPKAADMHAEGHL